jgi:hypothetical protein
MFFRDLFLDLPQLAEVDAMPQTHVVCASRIESLIDPMMAEVTFTGKILLSVKRNDAIGAGLKAGLTAGAKLIIQDHDAVIPLPDRLSGTCFGAGRIVTVSAHIDPEKEDGLPINHPRPVFQDLNELHAVGRAHLLLAGHLAGLAAPTGRVVDMQCVFFHERLPLSNLRVDPAEQCSHMGCTHGRIAV